MAFKMAGYSYPGKAPKAPTHAKQVVDKDELKRQGKTGETERRIDPEGEQGVVGEIKGRLAERAGKTETKTRKFLGRTWTKTKKYDAQGRKIGKITEVTDKGGKKIRHRQKGDITTDEPVTTEMKTSKARRRDIDTGKGRMTKTTGKIKKTGAGTYVKPGGKSTGSMKDYALRSEARKKEYDARGWKYDETIKGYNKDGSKIPGTKTKANGDDQSKRVTADVKGPDISAYDKLSAAQKEALKKQGTTKADYDAMVKTSPNASMGPAPIKPTIDLSDEEKARLA